MTTTMHDGSPRTHASSRQAALRRAGVTVLLDGGANEGQYGAQLRADGYAGRIVSVEPLAAPFAVLSSAAAADGGWTAVRAALGAAPGEVELHVTTDTRCSSVLVPAAITALPGAAPAGRETVVCRTLDDVAAEHVPTDAVLAVKLDVQGYEAQVMAGAGQVLDRARVVEVELSLVATYEGVALLPELLPRLTGRGLHVVSIEPGHRDRGTGQVYDVDVLLERTAGS